LTHHGFYLLHAAILGAQPVGSCPLDERDGQDPSLAGMAEVGQESIDGHLDRAQIPELDCRRGLIPRIGDRRVWLRRAARSSCRDGGPATRFKGCECFPEWVRSTMRPT